MLNDELLPPLFFWPPFTLISTQLSLQTKVAATEIKDIMAAQPDKGYNGLRISVRTRGCSGNAFHLEYATEKEKMDEEVDAYVSSRQPTRSRTAAAAIFVHTFVVGFCKPCILGRLLQLYASIHFVVLFLFFVPFPSSEAAFPLFKKSG